MGSRERRLGSGTLARPGGQRDLLLGMDQKAKREKNEKNKRSTGPG